jgi:hypothetical protein
LATTLIGGATVLRVAAAFAVAHASDLLMLAAACWSGAFFAVSWLIQRHIFASRTQIAAHW